MQRSRKRRPFGGRYLSLLAFAALATALTGPLHAGTDENDVAKLFEQGLKAFEDGEYRTAIIHLKTALQQDSTALHAKVLLGRAYIEENSYATAEQEFQTAAHLGAAPSLTALPLATSYLMQGKYRQVVDELFPTTSNPRVNYELRLMRGESYLALGDYDKARQEFDAAAEARPTAAAPLLGRASILLQQDDPDGAEVEVAAAIELEPENAGARYFKGALDQAGGQLQDAMVAYEKALELDKDSGSIQVSRLGVLIDLGRHQEAKAIAEALRAQFPEDPRVAYLLAITLSNLGDQAGADQALKESDALVSRIPIEDLQKHAPSLLLAGTVAFGLQNYEQARLYLDRYWGLYPPAVAARKIMGATHLAVGQTLEAIQVLEPIVGVAPTDFWLLLLLGEAYMREHRYLSASEYLDRALQLQPSATKVRAMRAYSRLKRGQEAAAMEELRELFESQPGLGQVGALLADTYIKQGRPEEAAEVSRRLVAFAPEDLDHRNLLAKTLLVAERPEDALDVLDQILARNPKHRAAQMNLGNLDLIQGRIEQGAQRYRTLLDRNPQDTGVLLKLAQISYANGDTEEAIRLLKQVRSAANEGVPDALTATIYLADIYLATGQAETALLTIERASLRNPDDDRLLRARGRADLAMNRTLDAQAAFRRLSANAGYQAERLLDIAQLQLQAEDTDGAVWSLRKATEESPKLLAARLGYVILLGQLGKSDMALDSAQALADDFPDALDAKRLLGDALMRSGQPGEALTSYQSAMDQAPSLHLAILTHSALLATGKAEDAVRLLQDWLREHPNDGLARQALADTNLQIGNLVEARADYEVLLAQGARSASVLNNLAYAYASEDDARALAYAEEAQQLAPESAPINDTLGWLLVQAGEPARGLDYLRKAQAPGTNDPEIQYHIAAALNGLGQTDGARAELERAFSSGEPFPGIAEAMELRETLTR